ncbi:MAG TPA: hypothetical protein VIH35_05485 [Kiritimatiellia bacterium]|jgi:hypothetical protein
MKRNPAILLAALVAAMAAAPAPADQVVPLVAGENFFGLACMPGDLHLAAIVRGANLPRGTVLQHYNASAEPAGRHDLDDDVMLVPGLGYALVLPGGSANQALTIRGAPVTGDIRVEIHGTDGATNYTVLAWPRSAPVAVKDAGLVEAGLAGGVNVMQSDEIRVLDNSKGMGSVTAPKARIWIKDGALQFSLQSDDSAGDYQIQPGEVVIVVRKRGPSLTWTVPPSAAAP